MKNSLELNDVLNDNDWQKKTILVGAVIGLLFGMGSAYLLVNNAEKHGRKISVSNREGLKLSLLLIGTLRQIAQIGDED